MGQIEGENENAAIAGRLSFRLRPECYIVRRGIVDGDRQCDGDQRPKVGIVLWRCILIEVVSDKVVGSGLVYHIQL